ncbi:MAG TPA: GNAT family N-acetyltransferase [Bacteroidia bacterium]|nr:GNAT family N-acetyltransferase [Bacteroidia bacterium]
MPRGLSAEFFNSVSGFSSREWNSVAAGSSLFLSAEFLSAFEQAADPNVSFWYAVIREKQQAVGVVCFQVITLAADEIVKILKPAVSAAGFLGSGTTFSGIVGKLREEKGMRILICGNNFISGEYCVAVKKEYDAEKIYRAIPPVVKYITGHDRSRAKISAILVKDFFEKKKEHPSSSLKKKRYHRFMVEPEMVVDIRSEWKTFGDYLESMSKKYRNRAKKVMKDTETVVCEEWGIEKIAAHEEKIYSLYMNVHARAKFRLAPLGKNYFSAMKNAFPGKFRLHVYLVGGEPVAFRSSFLLKSHLEAHFIGLDYDANERNPLYQRILYDFVNEGITSPVPSVYLGRTASEIKSTVGAVAHDLVCYIRHRNSLSNQLIRPFIEYLKPSEWIPRNPFKAETVGTD